MTLKTLVDQSDFSGRHLREVQRTALEWVRSVWNNDRHIAISLPVGSGKSLIAKAIQNATGACIVTPNNTLVKQYTSIYKDLPYYIGKDNYKCKEGNGYSCAYKLEKLGLNCCKHCDYRIGREAALSNQYCVFNPLSLFHIRRHDDFRDYPITIIDEAHAVISLLQTLNTEKIRYDLKTLKTTYGIDSPNQLTNELYLIPFLKKELEIRKEELANYDDIWTPQKKAKRQKKIFTLESLIVGIEEDPQLFASHLEGSSVKIRCVKLPRSIIKRVFGNTRFILLSATLFKPDLLEMFDSYQYDYLDLPSPIPVQNRPIYFSPLPFSLNKDTPPKLVAEELDKILKQHPNVNTLVHMPYALAAAVAPLMKTKVFTHSPETKGRQLEKWIASGGVFLGSGLYEGIDLPGDLCRLNIIVKIPYPCTEDVLVKKRMALKDGNLWYAAQSLKAVVQSVGRSTRGETDYSDTLVLDPSFARIVQQNYKWLPNAFTTSIIWGRKNERKLSDVS